jgi:DNA-binding transcriptional LysR family regulator
MTLNVNHLDWNHVRSVLAVAETGSLTAAAKKTRQSQPTLGRHIKAAEDTLGMQLFVRTTSGLQLTEAGLSLLEPARDMAKASMRLAALAAGRDARLSGTVRITASVVVSHYLLPAIFAELRRIEPDIDIELVPSDTSESLSFREADIAVRMYRPTQLDIVTSKVSDHALALYASKKLLIQRGNPRSFEELAGLNFVGFDESDMIIRTMRALGYRVDRDFFGVRCDNQATYWELVRAGCGVGAMQTIIGDADPEVARLDFQPELPSLPVWLAAHTSQHKNPRVKRVWNHLASTLKR